MSETERPFEEIYADAGDNLDAIPWASLAVSPSLVTQPSRFRSRLGPMAM